jgi:hypothetical protein
MFRPKPADQFVERYHSDVSRVQNVEDLISNKKGKAISVTGSGGP